MAEKKFRHEDARTQSFTKIGRIFVFLCVLEPLWQEKKRIMKLNFGWNKNGVEVVGRHQTLRLQNVSDFF